MNKINIRDFDEDTVEEPRFEKIPKRSTRSEKRFHSTTHSSREEISRTKSSRSATKRARQSVRDAATAALKKMEQA